MSEGPDAPDPAALTERLKREALDAVLHGAESEPTHRGTRAPSPPVHAATTEPADGSERRTPKPLQAPGAWDALISSEEARWLRYGHPCVAVQLEVVGGEDLTAHLGDEAGRRIRESLEEVIASMTRAADRFEARGAWRLIALLPETDVAGADVAMRRLQQAFVEAMGSALAVRLAFGLAAPAPTGTVAVALHQAGQTLVAKRRRDRSGLTPSTNAMDPSAAQEAAIGPARTSDAVGAEPPGQATAERRDPVARLGALAHLLDLGLVTPAEYDAKRSEILDRL